MGLCRTGGFAGPVPRPAHEFADRKPDRLGSGSAQRPTSAQDKTNNLLHLRRCKVPAITCQAAPTTALRVKAEITGVAATLSVSTCLSRSRHYCICAVTNQPRCCVDTNSLEHKDVLVRYRSPNADRSLSCSKRSIASPSRAWILTRGLPATLSSRAS